MPSRRRATFKWVEPFRFRRRHAVRFIWNARSAMIRTSILGVCVAVLLHVLAFLWIPAPIPGEVLLAYYAVAVVASPFVYSIVHVTSLIPMPHRIRRYRIDTPSARITGKDLIDWQIRATLHPRGEMVVRLRYRRPSVRSGGSIGRLTIGLPAQVDPQELDRALRRVRRASSLRRGAREPGQ